MNREPVVTVSTVTGLISAVIALLVVFNVPISEDAEKAILGVVIAAAPVVAALIARRKVTPVSEPVVPEGGEF